eukprot:1806887-Amphidinium_carterae.1
MMELSRCQEMRARCKVIPRTDGPSRHRGSLKTSDYVLCTTSPPNTSVAEPEEYAFMLDACLSIIRFGSASGRDAPAALSKLFNRLARHSQVEAPTCKTFSASLNACNAEQSNPRSFRFAPGQHVKQATASCANRVREEDVLAVPCRAS